MLLRHVSTVAQNGQTKLWLQREPFCLFAFLRYQKAAVVLWHACTAVTWAAECKTVVPPAAVWLPTSVAPKGPFISAVLSLPFSLFEQWIQTTATCCYGELFPLTQAQNIRANWPLAVVFTVCSNATCRPRQRRREATQQFAFIATSSLMSAWCVWALK